MSIYQGSAYFNFDTADQLPTPISNIRTHVVVNQKLNASLQMQFQRIAPVVMERAIREIMPLKGHCSIGLLRLLRTLLLSHLCFGSMELPTPISKIGTHVVVNQKLNASLQMQFQRFAFTKVLLYFKWSRSRASFIPSPRGQGPSSYAQLILPQGVVPVAGWNAYPVLKFFPFPITITTFQFAIGTVLVLFMSSTQLYRKPKISSGQLVAILPLAVVHTLGNLFTNMSLGKVAVSFTHTIKAMEAFFSVVLFAMFLGEILRLNQLTTNELLVLLEECYT